MRALRQFFASFAVSVDRKNRILVIQFVEFTNGALHTEPAVLAEKIFRTEAGCFRPLPIYSSESEPRAELELPRRIHRIRDLSEIC